MSYTLEICCYNYESCIIASTAGANRIELCADAAEGGTTPAFGTIKRVKEKLSIPVYPIIRPRGGDFLCSDEEFVIMQTDILLCKELGCEGVVIGILQTDGSIDQTRCRQLVNLAYPMGVTFHRAFDRCSNPFEALENIIGAGFERILTSGHKPHAADGSSLIDQLIRQASDRIIIMPGSGVRAANIIALAKNTGATEFHSSASFKRPSEMHFLNTSMEENLDTIITDATEVNQMALLLQDYFTSNDTHPA